MKKIICVLLACSIILLSGCSALFQPQTGLIEIQGLDEYTDSVLSADFNGESWVLLATAFVPDENSQAATEPPTEPETEPTTEEIAQEVAAPSEEAEEGSDPEEEEYIEEPQGNWYYTINIINPKNARVKKSIEVKDCPIENYLGIKFDGEGNIVAYNEYEKKCVTYSPDLKEVSKVKNYEHIEYNERAKNNVFFDDSFSCFESFAYDYNEYDKANRVAGYMFYDDNENIYLSNKERFSPNCGYDRRILGSLIEDKIQSSEELRIYDFSTSTVINKIKTPAYGEKRSASSGISFLRDGSAFISVFDFPTEETEGAESAEEIYYNHYYIWNYSLDAQNTPFEVKKRSPEALEEENEALCREFNESYGIDVHLNEANQYTLDNDEIYALELDATPYKLYSTLIGMKSFFDALPDGFVKETYTGMEHIEVEGFDIYIGSRVKGYPNAYANRWNEKFQIAIGAYTFSVATFAHEYMHIIDARLDDLYWEEGLDILWSEYNPKGFEYLGYQENNPESWEKIDFSKHENDFVSFYAMSEATEDRADTFSSLFTFTADEYSEKPYWYKENTPAAKKALFLCKSIRKAFPCMKNAPVQPWEEALKNELSL